jgi:hypothetical protein
VVLVHVNSGDGSGLTALLSGWDPWWHPDDVSAHSRDLGAAILSLVSTGLVVVYSGMMLEDPESADSVLVDAHAGPAGQDDMCLPAAP